MYCSIYIVFRLHSESIYKNPFCHCGIDKESRCNYYIRHSLKNFKKINLFFSRQIEFVVVRQQIYRFERNDGRSLDISSSRRWFSTKRKNRRFHFLVARRWFPRCNNNNNTNYNRFFLCSFFFMSVPFDLIRKN